MSRPPSLVQISLAATTGLGPAGQPRPGRRGCELAGRRRSPPASSPRILRYPIRVLPGEPGDQRRTMSWCLTYAPCGGLAPQLHVRLLRYGERMPVVGFRARKAKVAGEVSEDLGGGPEG